ncbi:hypothetical protein SFRURICE_017035 [Spodoptera frugiperda]|nr:hypothetical protein SFRURICE_017035 [Spodoptera frugiperda]
MVYAVKRLDRRCPATTEIPEGLQVRCQLGREIIGSAVTLLTQCKRCFTAGFSEVMVWLRSTRPIRAEAWLSHQISVYTF